MKEALRALRREGGDNRTFARALRSMNKQIYRGLRKYLNALRRVGDADNISRANEQITKRGDNLTEEWGDIVAILDGEDLEDFNTSGGGMMGY